MSPALAGDSNHWITKGSSSRHSCPFSKFHPRSEQYSSLSTFFFFLIDWIITLETGSLVYFPERDCLRSQQLESSVKESGQS